MAVLNINILTPRIDLISNEKENKTSCKSVHTFDILSPEGSIISITGSTVSGNTQGFDKVEYNYNGTWSVIPEVSKRYDSGQFTTTARVPKVRVTIGNVENMPSIPCNYGMIVVTNHTYDKTESQKFERCVTGIRCDEPAPAPAPAPEPNPEEPPQSTDVKWITGTGGQGIGLTQASDIDLKYYVKSRPNIRTSVDGISWTYRDIPFMYGIYEIKYLNNQWVAVGISVEGGSSISVSSDGITWYKKRSDVLDKVIISIDYDGTKYIALGVEGNTGSKKIASSTDLDNWTSDMSLPNLIYPIEIKYRNNRWAVVGDRNYNDPSSTSVQYSDDGINWNQSDFVDFYSDQYTTNGQSMLVNSSYEVEYGNGMWLVGGLSVVEDRENWVAGELVYSTDNLSTLNNRESISGGQVDYDTSASEIEFNGEYWMVLTYTNPYGGSTTTRISKSVDGINWVATNTNGERLTRLTHRGSEWMSSTTDGMYMCVDGMTFSKVASNDQYQAPTCIGSRN